MAIPHAAPNQVVSVEPLGPDLATTKTWTVIKTERMQVIRLVVPAGKEIPAHDAPGEITVQCVEGRVAFTADSRGAKVTLNLPTRRVTSESIQMQ